MTGYDFLSNVPKEIQDIIEADNSRIPLAASLLGDTEITDSLGPEVFPTSGNFWIGDDFPVGHDSFTSLSGPRNIFQDRISEISSVENSTFKGNFNNIGFRDYYHINIFCFSDIICWVPLRFTQPTGERIALHIFH
ncbi:MAG: hypothetical protein V7K77_00715 [Nostoc sp.]|uniref:hypothetical protein n=1 Tax=Nostoc sp. TaxID=1180 RepID=UPI002FF5424C